MKHMIDKGILLFLVKPACISNTLLSTETTLRCRHVSCRAMLKLHISSRQVFCDINSRVLPMNCVQPALTGPRPDLDVNYNFIRQQVGIKRCSNVHYTHQNRPSHFVSRLLRMYDNFQPPTHRHNTNLYVRKIYGPSTERHFQSKEKHVRSAVGVRAAEKTEHL